MNHHNHITIYIGRYFLLHIIIIEDTLLYLFMFYGGMV